MNLAEPSQYTDSGPDFARISISLSPISSMAWSQETRVPAAVHQLHRIAQPALAQHVVADRRALAAVRAAIDRAVPARLLAGPHAVRDLGDDRAADRAMGADILPDRHRRAGRRRRAGLGLADAAQRQRAERGEAAGGEPGTAQEVATIKATVGLGGKCSSQRCRGELRVVPS